MSQSSPTVSIRSSKPAEVFPLSVKALYRACRRGDIGAKVNNRWVIKASELDAWYERCKAKPQPSDPEPDPSLRDGKPSEDGAGL